MDDDKVIIDESSADNKDTKVSKLKKLKIKKTKLKFSWKSLIVLLLLLGAIGAAVFFWNDARQAKQQTPQGVAQKNQQETQAVIDSLSKQILLEGQDKPTVARVENPDVLKKANQDFYKNVQKGDYLVLYPQRAIIYRLEENKIVNIAPIINTSDIQQNQQPVTTPTTNEDTTSKPKTN